MGRNRLTMGTKGFEEMFAKLDRANTDMKKITEDALEQTFSAVTPGIKGAIDGHERSGTTAESLEKEAKVEWEGTAAKVPVGFNIRKGGLPSVFLMYGTPKHMGANQYGKTKQIRGVTRDMELYNSVYGPSTKRKAKRVQEGVLKKEMRRIFE